jgi:hypothetical protein
MSKIKGDGEPNWAEMDKRIRNRRWLWTTPELEKLEQGLQKLPDLTGAAHLIELEQPAIGPRPADTASSEDETPTGEQPRTGELSS